MAVISVQLVPLDDAHVPDAFVGLFADNAGLFGEIEGREDIARYLHAERARLKSELREIRLGDGEAPIGLVTWLAPHPREPHPWIGILALDAAHRGRGIGAEVADTVEEQLASEGWREVRLATLLTQSRARTFWERRGYVAYDERPAEDGRMCSVLRKVLPGR